MIKIFQTVNGISVEIVHFALERLTLLTAGRLGVSMTQLISCQQKAIKKIKVNAIISHNNPPVP